MKLIATQLQLLIVFFIFLFFLPACTHKPSTEKIISLPGDKKAEVVLPQPDLLLPEVIFEIPQQVTQAVSVSHDFLLTPAKQAVQYEQALKHFFAPWKIEQTSLTADQAFWGVRGLGSKQGYAENLQPYPRERWDRLVALQNMPTFPSLAQPAIITRNTFMRVLPSLRPFFLDPSKPGEGFPFDYFQASALWLGTPVFICHISTDKAWYFVETAFASGWVRFEDVALAEKDFLADYETQAMAAILLDDTSLLATDYLLGQTHIGAIFPLHQQKDKTLFIKVPVRDIHARAHVALARLNFLQAAPMPVPLTSHNVATLADAMSGQLYGWGGMYENRDCSSTMRDLFLPFGLWLPRNSRYQAQKGGQFITLEGLSPEHKLAKIRSQGIPLASLLWLPGHIGLYLGTDKYGEPLMLHNIWGVRTVLPDGSEGRAVAGRLVISTLRPGENRPDVRRGAFLVRIKGLTLLGARD